MTLQELLTHAFANSANQITLGQSILIIAAAVVCCALICVVYRIVYRGVLFSRSFCASIFAMGMITAFLILAIRTSITLTLGGLGALSVVRFRTAIKEPMDVTFMFFAICEGIICGANMLTVAFIAVFVLGGLLILYSFSPLSSGSHILMINAEKANDEAIAECLKAGVRSYKLKSKTIGAAGVEYAYEIALKKDGVDFADKVKAIDGVRNVSIAKSSCEYI